MWLSRLGLGYTATELLSLSIDLLYADPHEAWRMGRRLHEAAGRTVYSETHLKSKSGEIIPIGLSATWLRDADGNREGSVGYFEDHRSLQHREQ